MLRQIRRIVGKFVAQAEVKLYLMSSEQNAELSSKLEKLSLLLKYISSIYTQQMDSKD